MARLIDATRIEQFILNNCSDNEEINAIYAEIINAPTVDPIKHGHWIDKDDGIITGTCSVCGWNACLCETDVNGMPYCPNCGAIMDEGRDYEHAVEQLEHNMTFEPTYNLEDGSM